MSQNAALLATDFHSRYELDDVTQCSAWSHKLAPTATQYHVQSKLGVMALGVLPGDFCTQQVTKKLPAQRLVSCEVVPAFLLGVFPSHKYVQEAGKE